MRGVEQKNVSRGLGYGNLNEAMKEQQRAQSQQELAGSISNANMGLLDLGNQIRGGAIDTGLGLQRIAQDRLNQIYQREAAMNRQRQENEGSALGLLAQIGMMAAMA